MKTCRIIPGLLVVLVCTLTPSGTALAAERVNTTSDTLLDRIQVEDFLNEYYWELAGGASGDLAYFWSEDAVFDVNGNILNGLAEIEAVYAEGLGPGGQLVFQMDIPLIRISGNTAVVDLIYTGILNTDPDAAPTLYEQGRDHVELRKTNGAWKITRRTLRSISLDSRNED